MCWRGSRLILKRTSSHFCQFSLSKELALTPSCSLMSWVRELKAERFDYIIDLHHNLRTQLN